MTTPFQPEPMDQVERRHIEAMLRHCDGNKRRAALALGLHRATLYRKLAQYRDEDARREAALQVTPSWNANGGIASSGRTS